LRLSAKGELAMYSHNYDVIIAGSGLAALSAAARLIELGISRIGLFSTAFGGTPYIAAINFVLPDNPYGDTPELYCRDMLEAGYWINDRSIVENMTKKTAQGYELLCRWGIEFARTSDGTLVRRRTSGSSFPRSLCRTTELVGQHIEQVMKPMLIKKGVDFHTVVEIVNLIVEEDKVIGFLLKGKDGSLHPVCASYVIAAWGGVGTLLGKSTYPSDVNGRTFAMAFEAGADLSDFEFLEYEPMVVLYPEKAFGEPCPTAMLAEGAYLLNTNNERFLLKARPEGEAGAPKSLINKAIWKEVEEKRGTEHGGVYVDIRHIDRKTVRSYPWFCDRLESSGINPHEQLIEVGPVPHSFSGGVKVDPGCCSSVKGLYAIGEAAAGFHGACRIGGNAASQAVLSGLMCAEDIAKKGIERIDLHHNDFIYHEDIQIRHKLSEEINRTSKALGIYRNEKELLASIDCLENIKYSYDLEADTYTKHRLTTILLMLTAALARKESRGSHMRTDYPEMNKNYLKSIILSNNNKGGVVISEEPRYSIL